MCFVCVFLFWQVLQHITDLICKNDFRNNVTFCFHFTFKLELGSVLETQNNDRNNLTG